MISIAPATNQQTWDDFLVHQTWRPFLQSWTMGEVYGDVGQSPVRLEIRDEDRLIGICFGHIVPAKRGRHLSVPYGPVLAADTDIEAVFRALIPAWEKFCKEHACTFVRFSPFWQEKGSSASPLPGAPGRGWREAPGEDVPAYQQWMKSKKIGSHKIVSSPLHLLGEHIWYIDLKGKTEDQILMAMRKTTRNLVRRAEKDGVTIIASAEPEKDVEQFITLHDETRLRHGFTPYTNSFFRSQVKRFAPRKECTVYLARYQDKTIAASIHMHLGGETSYHHGASADAYKKIPSSYLLQWTAIRDAMKRGDHLYNFWGIAPMEDVRQETLDNSKKDDTASEPSSLQSNVSSLSQPKNHDKKHPFAGVTLFKTGFGGQLLNLVHCMDIPFSSRYHVTRAIETVRKWRRGF